MSQGEEEIIIIGGGGRPKSVEGPRIGTAAARVDHLRAKDNPDPYDLARAMIDEAEAFQLPVTFETQKAKA